MKILVINPGSTSTTSDDSIEIDGDICFAEFIDDQLLTEVLLLDDIVETCQLFRRVYDITDENGSLILEDSHLGGGRTRVNDKDLHDLLF